MRLIEHVIAFGRSFHPIRRRPCEKNRIIVVIILFLIFFYFRFKRVISHSPGTPNTNSYTKGDDDTFLAFNHTFKTSAEFIILQQNQLQLIVMMGKISDSPESFSAPS